MTRRAGIGSYITAGLLVVMTAGCGQKGPLYLPDHNGSVVTRQPPSAAQPAADQTSTPQQAPATAAPAQPTDKNDKDDSQTPK